MKNGENLMLIALVVLPLVAAICLGLFLRSVMNGGRRWRLWLIGMLASYVLWGIIFSGESP
jgi:predicted Na+-dependent transporter